MHIADSAGEETGESWYSISRIAERCECGRSSVVRHLKALQEMGFITLVESGHAGGKSSRYRVNISDEPSVTVGHPSVTVASVTENLVSERHQPSVTETLDLVSQRHTPSVTVGHKPIKEPVTKPVKNHKEETAVFELPDGISKSRFAEYLQMRRTMRKPATPRAKKMVCQNILEVAGETGKSTDEILDLMLTKNWLSIKTDWISPKRSRQPQSESIMDRAQRLASQ